MIFKLLFLLIKGAKLGKVLVTVGSMLLMVWTYQLAYGWGFSAGFVILLFVHEMGHILAAKQRGMNVSAPLFIPFLGAYIALRDQPHDVETEAHVAIAGPLAGTLGAILCYFLARYYDSDLLMGVAYSGFFLNLFNLIPISPLDGGRVVAVLSPRIWLIGVPVLVAAFCYVHSPLLIVIGILAWPQLVKAWRYDKTDPANLKYYAIPARARTEYIVYYFGLAVFLSIMVAEMHGGMQPPHR